MLEWLKALVARPWARVALGVVLVCALAGGLAYAFRDNLARYALKPRAEFDRANAPPAPDYTNDGAWAMLPKKPLLKADLFFVYPSIYFGWDGWNSWIGDEAVRDRLVGDVVPLYAGPFADAANIFIPQYRQASPFAFMTHNRSAQGARLLAYEDVEAAFKNFLSARNGNRPFAIAAQGQGALYAVRLLTTVVAKDEAVRERFLTAYLSEIALPLEEFERSLKPLEPCQEPEQLGCINVWHSAQAGARNDLPRTSFPVWDDATRFTTTRGRSLACVNPLTWTLDGRAADESMNSGAAQTDHRNQSGVSLSAPRSGADCWNGLLFVDEQPPPLFTFTGPRYRDLYPPRVNLFFENTRQNFQRRLEAYRQATALPPIDGTAQTPPSP